MQTINIFISRTRITGNNSSSTEQIKFLKKLCINRDIDFPFKSMPDAKNHLKKSEARRALKELLEKGNTIKFIYPIESDSNIDITFFDSNIYSNISKGFAS